ncbi:MAG: bifunctional 4-hydroxy-2-oxoglutarate aldolase/2-dehydro-3-deoxy-phosphogluconate aldolase [Gammaproteobacteria bacterium]|nr:bifunctional 4-hydroxy-2-oxoglutarate aldolase/2-dehydro-3-deoxy-phosphogluconate aldolase [Gammaproteobacteria bacterium]
MNILEVMRAGPVIPVVVIDDLQQAAPLAESLVAGGVRVLEVTLRTPVAMAAIQAIARAVPEAIVGVGTLTRPEEFVKAVDAGARFGVSPGLSPELVQAARDSSLPLLPGVMTPSEVITARLAGFQQMKLFPAQQAGGIGLLKALAGPFPDVSFCPTGGITVVTAPDFLALSNVACVGGSWLTPQAAMAAGDWSVITKLAKEASGLRPGAGSIAYE